MSSPGTWERKGLSFSSGFLQCDNAWMHSAKLTQEYLKKRGVLVLKHAHYSPDLALFDFSLFPKLKKELAGVSMTPEVFRKKWGRLLRSIPKEEFTTAFLRLQERFEKRIHNGDTNVKKC
jgi:hypothetical protein